LSTTISQVDNTQTVKYSTTFPFTIREYSIKDEAKVLELLQLVYKKAKINSDYLNWKYFDNPLRKHGIVVAEYQDQIVGTNCGFYRETKVGKNMYLTSYGGDLAVHPDYRRRGIANKMKELKEEIRVRDGIQLSSAITDNPIVINNRNKQGYPPFPKKLFEMMYIEDVNKEDLSLIKKRGYQVYKSAQNLMRNKKTEHSDIIISETKSYGDEADLFWENIRDYYDLMFKRNSSYLNWRYCDPRAGGFKVFSAVVGGNMCGYCVVLGNKANESSTGYIVDLCVLPGMKLVTRCLLEKAVETLVRDVNIIKYLVVDGHPNVPVFSSYGFAPLVSNFEVRYVERHKSVREDYAVFYQASGEKLFLQYGDTDLFLS